MPKSKKQATPEQVRQLDACMEVLQLPEGIRKRYRPGEKLFKALLTAKPKEPGKVKMYGKIVDVPRTQQSYLRDYTFTDLEHKAEPEIPDAAQEIYDWAQASKYKTFNQMLINWYENGHQYIGAHSDSEDQLQPNSEIMSVSLGETRLFRIRAKATGAIVKDISLAHGTVIVMKGKMQKLFKHEIVRVDGKKGLKLGCRINVTFRKFK